MTPLQHLVSIHLVAWIGDFLWFVWLFCASFFGGGALYLSKTGFIVMSLKSNVIPLLFGFVRISYDKESEVCGYARSNMSTRLCSAT